jgi:GTPase SAR1 family protein
MAKPAVVLVGADKGGVGKTTICRTLLDYLGSRNIPTRAFDTEWPRGTLKRFHPNVTQVVDVTSVADQMKIFDTIETSDARITLIDVRAGLMSPTLRALRDFGFLEAARNGQVNFALFHILGATIASLDEIAETSKFLTDARYFLVKNFVNNTTFFEWDQRTYNNYFNKVKDAVEITIPHLDELACEQVELASVPFVNFIANQGRSGEPASYSFVLRGYVRHWLNNVWAEYDRVKFTDIVEAKEPAKEAAARQPRPAPSGQPAKTEEQVQARSN